MHTGSKLGFIKYGSLIALIFMIMSGVFEYGHVISRRNHTEVRDIMMKAGGEGLSNEEIVNDDVLRMARMKMKDYWIDIYIFRLARDAAFVSSVLIIAMVACMAFRIKI